MAERVDSQIVPSLEKLEITPAKIFEDENFREKIVKDLSDHDPETIWKVLSQAVNISLSPGKNVDLQIDIAQLLDNLRITSERIFEYENFRAEFANGLNDVGFNVNNHDLERILKVVFEAANSSVSATPLLEELRKKSKQIIESKKFWETMKTVLKQQGYEGCDEDNSEGSDEDNSERIWKVLLRAVNSSVRAVRYANLRDEKRLGEILEEKPENLTKYFSIPITQCANQLKSPKDIANKNILGITKDASIPFVTKLIEQQFSIQWDAVREPEDFNFYTFCDVERLSEAEEGQDEQLEGKTKHLQYNPRRAHVNVQLYRFCRTKTIKKYSKKALCPPVYIRRRKGWEKWVPSGDTELIRHPHFDWMNQHIYQYISSHARKIRKDDRERALTRHTLYWVVVQDDDFQPGDHLQLNGIGKTQVYVGKATGGIKGRWLKNGGNHCKMMKKCLDNVQKMTTYDPLRLEGIQLVDAMILLARLREEELREGEVREKKCALFVMKTYEVTAQMEADERAQINGILPQNTNKNINLLRVCREWKPKNMAYGMNCY